MDCTHHDLHDAETLIEAAWSRAPGTALREQARAIGALWGRFTEWFEHRARRRPCVARRAAGAGC